MSDNLRKLATKLLRLAKLPKKEVCAILKTAPRKLIYVLSEIAYNVKEGLLKVSARLKSSKLVKILSDKKTKLNVKQKALRTIAAPLAVKRC